MKILFVASRFPYPLIQGDRVRAYYQLRLLSQRHQITLLTPIVAGEEDRYLKEVKPFCARVEAIPVSRCQRALSLLRAPFTSLPLQTLYYCDRAFRRKAESLVRDGDFDLIHVQTLRTAPSVDRTGSIPKVIDLGDALSLNMMRRARHGPLPIRWICGLEARRLKRYEQALAQRYGAVLLCSRIDQDAIGTYPSLHVVPQGVALNRFAFVKDGREPNSIVFTGRLGYFPNADAVQYFISDVFPLIRAEVPEARFIIVGGDLPPDLERRAKQAGATIIGHVPEVHIYLRQASVAVAPMRAGTGMQFKVLEAMATGTPVVATPYAIGGLEAEHGKHLLLADGKGDFARHVTRLLRDQNLSTHIARTARQLVEERYSWEHSVSALEDIYRLSLSRGRRSPNVPAHQSLGNGE